MFITVTNFFSASLDRENNKVPDKLGHSDAVRIETKGFNRTL